MEAFLALYIEPFLIFVLVLSRIGGLVMTAPMFSSRSVPARIRVLCDVKNSLLGPRGAEPVFAPQKGATPPQARVPDHERATNLR